MNKKFLYIITPCFLFVLYMMLSSSSGGINGQSVAGCTCHGSVSNNTLVTITGLPAGGYTNGTVYPITISVTNTTLVGTTPFGLRDGFNLTATTGAFTAIAGTALNGATEIRHTTPKAPVSGTASWTFNWTAPASGNASVAFFVSGNATNGNGSSAGDQWNQTSAFVAKNGVALSVSASAPNILCNGGTATVTATAIGGSPAYQYCLNAGTFQSGNTFSSVLAGTYTVTVRDATLATASTVITLNQPTAITATPTAGTILCNPGTTSITVAASGGTGAFTYRLNTGAYQASNTFNTVAPGTYTITARDANLCTKTSTIVVSQPAALSFTAPVLTQPSCNGSTGAATVNAVGGTGTKTYTINPLGPQSNTTGVFSGLTGTQVYTATCTDANNCTKTITFTMTQPSLITFGSPTTVQPPCSASTGQITLTATGGTGAKTYTIQPLGPQSNTTGVFTGLSGQVYTITATDANNCTKTSTVNLPCIPVPALSLKLFSQGYYAGASLMVPTLNNQGLGNPLNQTDTLELSLRAITSPYNIIFQANQVVQTNGTLLWDLPPAANGNSYYVVIRHRNILETWSQNPITINGTTTYDFSISANQAYGGNQIEMEPGVFAFYTGDITQDGVVDGLDFGDWENDNNNFAGGYVSSDFNGDGVVDGLDFLIWEPNNNNFVGIMAP